MSPIVADLLLGLSLIVAPALAAPQPAASCAPGFVYVPQQPTPQNNIQGNQYEGPWCEKFVTVTDYVTVYRTVNAGSGAQRLQPTTEAELKTSTITGTLPAITSSSVRAGATSSLASVTRTLTVVLETTSSTHAASTPAPSAKTSTAKTTISSQSVARANPSSVSVAVSASASAHLSQATSSVSSKASTSTLSLTRVSSSSTSSKPTTSTQIPWAFSTSVKPISTSTQAPFAFSTSIKPSSTSTQIPFAFSTSVKPSSTSTQIPFAFSTSVKPSSTTVQTTSKPSTTSARPTTTSTSKAAAAPTAIPIVAHNGKRGLAYNTVQYTLPFVQFPKVSWAYNWYSATGLQSGTADATTFGANFKYAPMLWSNASDLESVWNSNVQQSIQYYGTDAVLAFNEPDGCYGGGSCMDVPSAVAAWRKYMEPLAGKVRLGAPAVTNGGAPMGLAWLTEFLDQCTGCTIDFVPLHYYGDGYWNGGVEWYVSMAYQQINKPIWVTEFGISNSVPDSQAATFLESAMSFLDSASYVERYAFFWDGPGGQTLIDTTTGQPSALGQLYGTF